MEGAAETGALAGGGLWCRTCGEPVRRLRPGPLGKIVHAESGAECGHDGHAAMPADEDPALRAEADLIEADYGCAVTLTVRFGFFRADVKGAPPGVTCQRWEAPDGAGIRRKLDAALSGALPVVRAAGGGKPGDCTAAGVCGEIRRERAAQGPAVPDVGLASGG